VVCLAPRALKDSVRPRRLAGVVTRPLNFTVRCLRNANAFEGIALFDHLLGRWPPRHLGFTRLRDRGLASAAVVLVIGRLAILDFAMPPLSPVSHSGSWPLSVAHSLRGKTMPTLRQTLLTSLASFPAPNNRWRGP
jgi:hypothetical protein